MSFQRKVPGIEQMYLRIRQIAAIRFRSRWKEMSIVPTPGGKKRGLIHAKIALEFGVERDIAPIVKNEVELDLLRAGPGHVGDVQGIAVRRYTACVRTIEVLPVTDGLGREGCPAGFTMISRGLAPIGLPGSPGIAEALEIGIAVLADDRAHAVGVGECYSVARGRTVIEDIENVASESDRFSKVVDNESEVIEAVLEPLPGRSFGIAEAGQIRGDDAIAAGKEWDQVTKHAARGWESVRSRMVGA